MSRVQKPKNKFMNTPRHDASVTGPSKVVRIHTADEDYHRAVSLTGWLFMKYDMSYKAFRRKSRARREALRLEYAADTGADPEAEAEEIL